MSERFFADMTLREFDEILASKAPVPGGGGASAVAGALAAALGEMVCNLTIGKKKYAAFDEENMALCEALGVRREALLTQIDADAEAFTPLAAAYGIPKDDPTRADVMEEALRGAVVPPLAIMQECAGVIQSLVELRPKCSLLAISDVGVGATLAAAALRAASLNVFINTSSMADRAFAELTDATANAFLAWADQADALFADVAAFLKK